MHTITQEEEELFAELRQHADYRDAFYADGVPSPPTYLRERIRVVFVLREPNIPPGGNAEQRALHSFYDLRRALPKDDWWLRKVAPLAHATRFALDGATADEGLAALHQARHAPASGELETDLLRHGYVQIKKLGGGGVQVASVVKKFADRHADQLRKQLRIYKPDLVIACGRGAGSPARLLAQGALQGSITGGAFETAERLSWWSVNLGRPSVMLEFNHPAWRGNREALYRRLHAAVGELHTHLRAR